MDSDFWRQSAVLVAAVGQTLFIVIYGFVRWWKDYVGRALFFKSATLAIFLDTTSVYILIKRAGYDTDLVVAVLYWLVAIACWVQLMALLRVKHESRRPFKREKRDELPEL